MSFGLVGLAKTDPFAFFRAIASDEGMLRLRRDMAITWDRYHWTHDVGYDSAEDVLVGMREGDLYVEPVEPWVNFSKDCKEILRGLLDSSKEALWVRAQEELSQRHTESAVRLLERQYVHQNTRIRKDAETVSIEMGGDILVDVLEDICSELDDLFGAVLNPGEIRDTVETDAESEPIQQRISPIGLADDDPRRKYSDEQAFWVLDKWEELRTDDSSRGMTLKDRYNRLHMLYGDEFGSTIEVPSRDTVRGWIEKAEQRWR